MSSWILQTLLGSTLLMIAVAALRPLLRGRVGPRFIYALWLLPALRLVMPPLPLLGAETGIAPALPIASAGVPSVDTVAPDLTVILITIWLAGAFLWFVWQGARYRHFLKKAWADSVGSAMPTAGILVYRSGAVDGPVAVGVFRRKIVIPLDFEARFDPREQRCALAHEAMHHRRRDLLANLAAMVVVSLHWFNPLAHRAHLLFRTDQEMACDADVLRALGEEHAAAYASALLKAAAGGTAVLCRLSHVALLKARLRGLALQRPRRRQLHIAGLALGVSSAILMLSAATRAQSAAPSAKLPTAKTSRSPTPRSVQPSSENPAHKHSGARRRLVHATRPLPSELPDAGRAAAPTPAMLAAARGRPVDDSAYLEQRAAMGLARARARYASPAAAATARGRPILVPLSPG